jgi:hypothetical protein
MEEGKEYLRFITAGISYISNLSLTLRTRFIKFPKKGFWTISLSSSVFKIKPSLYSLSISEKHVKGMSELDSVAAIAGIRL